MRVCTIGIDNLRARIIGINKLSVHIIVIGNLRVRLIGIDFQYYIFQQNSIRIVYKAFDFPLVFGENSVSILPFVYITHRMLSNSFIILKTILLKTNASNVIFALQPGSEIGWTGCYHQFFGSHEIIANQ